jgi:hypothetical protein
LIPLFGLIFSAIGGIYVFYARRQHDPIFLVIGVALMVYPYFVSSLLLLVAIGITLSAIPVARTRGWF